MLGPDYLLSVFIYNGDYQKKVRASHSWMRGKSWHFLSTFLENLVIEVLFNADFDGVVQIVDFRQGISVKKYNLSFCTCLDKHISFLAFSTIFWGFFKQPAQPQPASVILRFCMF